MSEETNEKKNQFTQPFKYKLIYIFSMPYETHKGLLKIGEATIKTSESLKDLVPNCKLLNQAAKKRINSYTGTAGTQYDLLYTELAVQKSNEGYLLPFSDKDVHAVLKNSGISNRLPNGETGVEWFETTLDVAKNAIAAVKAGKKSLSSNERLNAAQKADTIVFRDEQEKAIQDTLKVFAKSNKMLWFAKMRFGKTLTALEVIKRSQYQRVIIATHRPVVTEGWSEDFSKLFYPGCGSEHEYSFETKTTDGAYTFDEKTDSENDLKIRNLVKSGAYFIYFTSIQDLRGSQLVGGNFNKNNAVFEVDWDLVIVDEAHEGTQTELGDNVLNLLCKKKTKMLELSGTPFNLLSQFEADHVYTWDYVMEQKTKREWDLKHFGDHNPYANLPQMHIYTYDLGEKLRKYVSDEYGTKAFNFKEFFRVWYKGPNGKRILPENAIEGKFVHEDDIKSFLDLLVKEDEESVYPYSKQEYRDMFRHTLWMVPGVKEARALSELLRAHPIFGHGFGIANVAGEGDRYEEEHSNDALKLVQDTIQKNEYSITLSCGKLTTGVTVPQWTAAFMLSGSYSTSAAQYLQTIFRVQSAGKINGCQKTDCYVFDFAPDRTLKVLAETVHLSRKSDKGDKKRREHMQEFLNFCPVIAIESSRMKEYSVNSMMEQIKQVFAERAVNSGFEDESIYNEELFKLNEIDASKFNDLNDIIGKTTKGKKKNEIIIDKQGLNGKQINDSGTDDGDDDEGDQKKLTPEEEAAKKAKQEAKKNRKKAIDILRGISIRMPLLIYGADVSIDEEIDVERFVELVDENSWNEFMPSGVTKEIFRDFIKYYDRDVFIASGKRIRRLAAEADKETPTRRVQMIADIFRHFKNPDKETVLTPWNVVNRHMSDTIGGWTFFDDKFEADTENEKHSLENPRFVDRGDVTSQIFREEGKVLEINSKTGLYPLYVAYSFYRQKLEDTVDEDWEPEELTEFWNEVIQNNVFVICKTPMAKSITQRTLCGYSNVSCNAHCFDDLVNMLKNKPEQFRKKVLRGAFWNRGEKNMVFDAVVGNPPYQEETAKQISMTNGQLVRKSIFQYFQMEADDISNGAVSLIYPGARWIHRSGKGMDKFGLEQINDKSLAQLDFYPDAQEIFKDVAIADGITMVYKNKKKDKPGFIYNYHKNGLVQSVQMQNPGTELMMLNPQDAFLVNKVDKFVVEKDLAYIHDRILPRSLFGIESNFVEENPEKVELYKGDSNIDFESKIKLFTNDKAGKAGRATWYVADRNVIQQNREYIDEWQVVVSSANAGGQKRDNKLGIVDNHSAFGRSRVALSSFKTEEEAVNFYNYSKTFLIRFMYLMTDESLTSLGKKVPDLLDYTSNNSMIDFSKNLNSQLYKLVGLSDEEISYVESVIKNKDGLSIYNKMLRTSYKEIVKHLLKKYGKAKHDYFQNTSCSVRNPQVPRTDEGLYCHHIDEDKAIKLSTEQFAVKNPFEYQKANRLVYCNVLEHFILHVKIAEEAADSDSINGELLGIGGASTYICQELNDIYSGKEISPEWRRNIADKVKDDFDDYILALKYLWNVVENSPMYQQVVSKESLCIGTDKKIVPAVYDALFADKLQNTESDK